MISRDDITLLYMYWVLQQERRNWKLEMWKWEIGNQEKTREGSERLPTVNRPLRLREVRHTVVASLSLVLAFLAEVTGRGYQREGRAVPRSLVGGQDIGNGENKCAKRANYGGVGACSPSKIFHFRHSEMVSGAIWQIVQLVVHMDPARLW